MNVASVFLCTTLYRTYGGLASEKTDQVKIKICTSQFGMPRIWLFHRFAVMKKPRSGPYRLV